jgi:hypothetical protein
MGRITPIIAALVVALVPACRRERGAPATSPKTTEPTAAAAQDEAESALDTAREAKATADSALATAREAQAAAAGTSGGWWSRAPVEAPRAPEQTEADRISVAGRVTESGAERLVVEPVTGAPLAARVEGRTQITRDGHIARAVDLAPGTEVRLLYRLDGAQVIAERVDVQR